MGFKKKIDKEKDERAVMTKGIFQLTLSSQQLTF